MKKSQIQVRSLAVNAANISHETIDGVDHIVVRGVVPIVDDIVMNGGLYPASEINASYKSIEDNLMPMSHPKIGSDFVSAMNPRAVNAFHVGAWATNVRKDGGKVVMDMKVNTQMANATDNGKRLIDRLNAMESGEDVEPIHVSTGLLLNRQEMKGNSKGKDYTWVASNMNFDHVAILLDEPGAGTPSEGVGIFVNAQDEKQDVELIVCQLDEATNATKENWLKKIKNYLTNSESLSFDDITDAIYNKLRSVYPNPDDMVWISVVYNDNFIYRQGGASFRQSYVIDQSGQCEFAGDPVEVIKDPTTYSIKTNGDIDQMKDLITNALKAKGIEVEGKTEAELLEAYNESMKEEKPEPKKPTETVEDEGDDTKKPAKKDTASNADVEALRQEMAEMRKQLNAQKDSELAEDKAAIKSAFNMSDESIAAMSPKAIKELAANCKSTYGLNSQFAGNSGNQKTTYEMPEA